MNKVKLRHQQANKQLSEGSLRMWVEQGIGEGLGAHNIQDAIKKMFDAGKITQMLIDSLTPEIMNAVTPYYREEFYSAISGSGDRLIISPWWDDCWQEIKIVDLVKRSAEHENTEQLNKMRDTFVESVEILDKLIKESK